MIMMGRAGLREKLKWAIGSCAMLCRRGFDLQLRRSVPDRINASRHADADGCSDSPIHSHDYGRAYHS